MNKNGYIKITVEKGKTPIVEAELVNGNIWMTKWAMDQLFNCYFQKIEMNLRSIFKSGLLREDDVSYTYRYTEKGIEKQTTFYNLEVIIFLSYRIATFEAKVFRQFLNSALREHLQRKQMERYSKLIWYFSKNQTKDYWLN